MRENVGMHVIISSNFHFKNLCLERDYELCLEIGIRIVLT
jgi:hypothetical protein